MDRWHAKAMIMILLVPFGAIEIKAASADRMRAVQVAAARVAPSVVVIERYEVGSEQRTEGELSTGNGLVVDAEGRIATSLALAGDSDVTLLVRVTRNGTGEVQRHAAKVLARDFSRNVALLECPAAAGLPVAPWLTADATRVGETVVAVSASLEGSPVAVSIGILSAKERLWGRYLQTDARISPAFYGGPLVNLRGEVIGLIIPAIPDEQSDGDPTAWYDAGIAFAVPAWDFLARREELSAGQDIRAGLAGMTPVSTDPYIGPPKVAGVRPYSPAARAEVRAGDVITAIAGEPTPYNGDIRQRLGRHDAGQTVRFSLLRDGMAIERDLELVGELPPFVPQRLGLHARSEGASLLVTHVDADSPAGRLGLQSGDRLTMASEQTIDSPSALRQALIAHPPGEAFSLRWIRGEQAMQGESVLERISEAVPKEAVTGDEWPTKWQSKSLPLPDVKNLAWALVPDEGEPPPQSLGLVILLAEPGAAKPEELLRGLEDLAGRAGVVFAVVTATLPERWDGSELEVVERVANQLQNSLPIQSDRILVAGRGAAGAMALVVALAKRATFRAAAVEFEKLPRLRLSENDPGQSVQLLFAGPVATEAPVESLRRLGYPVRLQGSIPSPQDWLDLLGRFNRSLDEF